MTNEDRLRTFWCEWSRLYRQLRPQQAEHLLKCWPLFKAVAWGQVDLSLLFAQDFSQVALVTWETGGDTAPVREFSRKVHELVHDLVHNHPNLLRGLPHLIKTMVMFAHADLSAEFPLISAMAVDYPVPPSPCSLYQLMLACEFGEYGPEIYRFPWHQDTHLIADQPLCVSLVRSKYESALQAAAQIQDMGHSAADFRTLLRFARSWRDLGEQELTVVSLEAVQAGRFPVYSYQATGTTKLAMLKADRVTWKSPALRVLAISGE